MSLPETTVFGSPVLAPENTFYPEISLRKHRQRHDPKVIQFHISASFFLSITETEEMNAEYSNIVVI